MVGSIGAGQVCDGAWSVADGAWSVADEAWSVADEAWLMTCTLLIVVLVMMTSGWNQSGLYTRLLGGCVLVYNQYW